MNPVQGTRGVGTSGGVGASRDDRGARTGLGSAGIAPPRAPGPPRAPEIVLVGQSPAFRELVRRVDRVAGTDSAVLIAGESGTGKTCLARLIHERSARRRGPFVAVNCAAIPEGLFEAELFGHAAGAFTGATGARKGLFESAHGGTLLLDEVGETPLGLQAKLLHAIYEQEIRRVGEARAFRVDVRVMAATNQDLKAAVLRGRFRADLYYRLAVLPLAVPPLRERREDIPIIAQHRLSVLNRRLGKRLRFAAETLRALQAYDLPGNVRELDNLVEGMALLASGDELRLADLPEALAPRAGGAAAPLAQVPSEAGPTLREAVEAAEREAIERALRQPDRGLEQVAAALGVSTVTLWRKMKRLGIQR